MTQEDRKKYIKLLAAFMMVSVSERFALLFEWGFSSDFASRLNLEGTPYTVATRIVQLMELERMTDQLPQLEEKLKRTSLPARHPNPFVRSRK